ncbi:MAG: WD40/YVTN/BNR-like repeat-containing protein, partial [Gemmatimonadaceae bacterium]
LWVGTNDGLVQLTRDGGKHWTNVTGHIPNLPAWGRIESIKLGAPGHAVIAADRHFLGDFTPYVYATDDFGQSWRSIVGNLPGNVYARSAMQDPKNPRLFYAGLENGLYTSWDGGAHWYLLGLGLPNVSIYDMYLQPRTNDLILATHGRSVWVFDDMTPFEAYTPAIASQPLHLFPIREAYRFWRWSEVEGLGDGAFYGKNPAFGAMITYTLVDSASTPGKLVITDAAGRVVRTMEGVRELGPDEPAPDETAPTGEPNPPLPKPDTGKVTGVPWVPMNPGMHRIYWDLRATGPERWNGTKEFNKGPESGAVVPPGTYTATLTVSGHTESQTFEVRNDPRSHAAPAAMEAQYAFSAAMMHQMSQLDAALNRLDGMRAQTRALLAAVKGTPNADAVDAAVAALDAAVDSAEAKITSNPRAVESTVRYPDMIREHLQLLMSGVEGSDQAPTAAQVEQKAVLDPEYRAAVQGFNDLLRVQVASFNRSMARQGATGVVAGEALLP